MTTVPAHRARGDEPVGATGDVGALGSPAASMIGGHRADIEGLRAIAVAVVLLYHAGVPWFDGGYVGVDVFFALSGYLMTGLLVDEHRRSGRISLAGFYARRARRLLPASVIVLLATTIASSVVLSPLAFERAAGDATAAGVYLVNLRFASEATDYLGADIGASPLLHFWSLAVEEQFYAVWPLLLWVAVWRSQPTGSHTRSLRPVVVLSVLTLVSFAIAYRVTATVQPWAFFGLHARAWEFGLGGLAAFASPGLAHASRRIRSAIGWLGLAAILWAVVTYGSTTRFPGPGAALPVIGTVLVLLCGTAGGGPMVVLSRRPMQWIGGRSYAMYLWHWPPLVLAPVVLDRATTVWENVLLVTAACGVAFASHRFVEDPIRYSTWLRAADRRNALLAVVATSSAAVVPWAMVRDVDLGGSVAADDLARGAVVDHVSVAPVPAGMRPALDAVDDDKPAVYADGCHADQRTVEPRLDCVFGDPAADRTMVLFGDSHMAQWSPAFDAVGAESGWRLQTFTKSACPSVSIGVYNVNFERDYTECDRWRAEVIRLIEEIDPDVVVLANYPRSSVGAEGDPADADFESLWTTGLRSTIAAVGRGREVLVLGPTPIPPDPVPDCVSGHLGDTRPCDIPRTVVRQDRIAAERALARDVGAAYTDVTDWFCGETTCPVVLGPYLVYRDQSHISTPYAEWLAPNLAQVVESVGF